MFNILRKMKDNVIQRWRRMSEYRIEKQKNEAIDDMIEKLTQLKSVKLDGIDVDELHDAQDIIVVLHNENCN